MSARERPASEEQDGRWPISHEGLLAVIRQNVDGMLVIDREGMILLTNPAAERLLGKPGVELEGTPFGAPLVLEGASEIDVAVGGRLRTAEMRIVEIDWRGAPALLASLRDVTDRKHAEGVLARAGEQHAALAQLGKGAVARLPPASLMAEAVKHVRHVLGTDFAGVLTLVPNGVGLKLAASDRSARVADVSGELVEARSQARFTLDADGPVTTLDAHDEDRFRMWPLGLASATTIRMQDGGTRIGVIEVASVEPRRLDQSELTFLMSVANLLAAALARFAAEGEARYQTLHDPLTGLPNRALFIDRLGHALERSKRQRTGLAVLFADLDGFKHVNDTLGHHAGDEVLVALAERLTGALRSSDSLARFGGDEFMMLLEDVGPESEMLSAIDRIKQLATGTPYVVRGQPQTLDLTIGVVRADEHHTSPDELIHDADTAMYRAKERGRGGYAVFDSAMRQHAASRQLVHQQLTAALAAGELRLHYQPIVSLDDCRIVEIEALLRWQHPERGLLTPGDFLDVAIESRLIVPIGEWALSQACRDAAQWSSEGDLPTVNVNLSPSELAQPDLRAAIDAAIRSGGPGVRLQVELTEGALIRDPALPAILGDLRETLGVHTSLDDFGTGYSSLSYLTRFQIDELKIDRSFISTLAPGHDAPIFTAIASMGSALGLAVVAEGIETAEQATAARRLGCDRGQGFFFARPLPFEEIGVLLEQGAPLGSQLEG